MVSLLLLVAPVGGPSPLTFPGAQWERRAPVEAGLDAAKLAEVEKMLGGRGIVVRHGRVVHAWGDQAHRGDWASSAKPVLSTLLLFAIAEKKVKGFDQPIADFGWELRGKDRGITFRHLGAMTSGYARPEGPGQAWAYNDYAIMLYQKTLFERVFRSDPAAVAHDARRLGALQLEDGLRFDHRARLFASVRDFARIAWLWLNHGRWGDRALIPRRLFDAAFRPQAPAGLPNSAEAETDDYLEIGTYGGGSNHFATCGPGIYGFNWWFNGTGRSHPDRRTWPDAPADAVMSIGVRGNCSVLLPSLGIVMASGDGDWGELQAGDASAKMNRVLATLASAAGWRARSERRP